MARDLHGRRGPAGRGDGLRRQRPGSRSTPTSGSACRAPSRRLSRRCSSTGSWTGRSAARAWSTSSSAARGLRCAPLWAAARRPAPFLTPQVVQGPKLTVQGLISPVSPVARRRRVRPTHETRCLRARHLRMDAAHRGISFENDPRATRRSADRSVLVWPASVSRGQPRHPRPRTWQRPIWNVTGAASTRPGSSSSRAIPVLSSRSSPVTVRRTNSMLSSTRSSGRRLRHPGQFDVILVVGGSILFAWSLLGGSTLGLWLGAIAVLLGLALPMRALGRRRSARREDRLRQQPWGVAFRSIRPIRSSARSWRPMVRCSAPRPAGPATRWAQRQWPARIGRSSRWPPSWRARHPRALHRSPTSGNAARRSAGLRTR